MLFPIPQHLEVTISTFSFVLSIFLLDLYCSNWKLLIFFNFDINLWKSDSSSEKMMTIAFFVWINDFSFNSPINFFFICNLNNSHFAIANKFWYSQYIALFIKEWISSKLVSLLHNNKLLLDGNFSVILKNIVKRNNSTSFPLK